jgi:hypothetical protein
MCCVRRSTCLLGRIVTIICEYFVGNANMAVNNLYSTIVSVWTRLLGMRRNCSPLAALGSKTSGLEEGAEDATKGESQKKKKECYVEEVSRLSVH